MVQNLALLSEPLSSFSNGARGQELGAWVGEDLDWPGRGTKPNQTREKTKNKGKKKERKKERKITDRRQG